MSRTWLKSCTMIAVFGMLAASCRETPKQVVAPREPRAILGSDAGGYDINTLPSGQDTINGAIWSWPVQFNVGTGQINPFLSVQADSVEEGFNSLVSSLDGKRYTNFTHDLALNHVPTIDFNGHTYREFILDANEANSGIDAQFAIQRFDLWLCNDPNAPQYDAVSDFASNSLCAKVYDLAGHTAYATDAVTSGSGLDLDYRILIPNSKFIAAAQALGITLTTCNYNGWDSPSCGKYLVLHTKMGGEAPDWVTGSTFEELSTIKRDVVPGKVIVKKVMVGGTATFSFTGDPAGSISVSGDSIYESVAPGQYTSVEGAMAGWTLTSVVCVDSNGAGEASTGDVSTRTATFNVEEGETVVCTFTNTKKSRLIVQKISQGDVGTFAFTSTGGLPSPADGSGNFSLTTTSMNTAVADTFSNLTPGSAYGVSETIPLGWALTSRVCSETTAGSAASTYPASGTTQPATVVLAPGATVTCTYTDTRAANLIIRKISVGGTGAFGFTSTGGLPSPADGSGNFTLTTASMNTAVADTFRNVTPGTAYGVSESVPTGWTLTSRTCSETAAGAGGSTFPASGTTQPASVTLAAGATVTCTYTDTKQPTLIIAKVTQGGVGTFNFTSTGGLTSPADGSGNFAITTATAGTAVADTFKYLTPATAYGVSETIPVDWSLTSRVCAETVAGAGGSTFPASGTTQPASVTLAAGATVTCTYTDTKKARLIIQKISTGGTGTFNFGSSPALPSPADGSGNFGLTTVTAGTAVADTFTYLLPGTYAATETVPAGWALTSRTCALTGGGAHAYTTPTNGVSVALAAGEDVTCTFNDMRLAVLVVQKEIPGTNSTIFEFLRGTMPAGVTSAFSLGDGDNSGTGRTLSPGTYSVCETPWAGWQDPTAQTGLNGGALGASVTGTYNLLTNAFCWSVNIAAGDSAFVLVTNTQPPGTTRTIGYWKNWTSCDGKGNQWAKALADDAYAYTLDANLPQTIGLLVLDKDPAGPDGQAADCSQAVNILSKSSIDGTKRPGDAAYNLAAQLLGAKLNISAGSGSCTAADNAISGAQTLLAGISFNGLGWYLTSKVGDPATATQANAFAATLDSFNNGTLGGGCPTHAP